MKAPTIVLLMLASGAAWGQTMPTTKVLNCTESGCHARQLEHKYLHGPTAVSACDACHEYKDPEKHAFLLKREGRGLCDFCHIDKTGTEGPVVHQPVAKGECTGCHDPHGSETTRMLKKGSMSELCLSCHKETMKGTHAHKPAAENCAACHQPHTSSHAKLLTMEKRALCLSCHEDVGKQIAGFSHPHQPVEGDCAQCHTPHASQHPHVLKESPKDLCISCHEPVGKAISAASHPHGAVTDERSCLNCHGPHGSDHAKQLLKDPVGACMECHQKPIVVDKDRTIPAAGELTVDAFHKHGPISKGECAACHDVHGGKHEGLLVEPYEQSFYQAYSDTAYALCFKCHDRALVLAETPEKETGFRNGVRNLHAVHVNKSSQGRSCRACHTVHASRFETMVADNVTFGQWSLPLNYVKTPTGGSCAPGCHKPAAYDRDTPAPPMGAPAR